MKRIKVAIASLTAALALAFAATPAVALAEEGTAANEPVALTATSTTAEHTYAHKDTATSGSLVLTVEWDDPVMGQETTFHVSAAGGSGSYKYYMAAPAYSNPNEWSFDSVPDPSRGEYTKYSDICEAKDFSFAMTASGTYFYKFYVMDMGKQPYTTLNSRTYVTVSDSNYPSVASIVSDAVSQARAKTDGSEYEMALWLHDWLLDQLEYDNSLKWASAEAALTRHTGTCQAYTNAYIALLNAAGITNDETRDTYDGHTWNAVKLDGEWYQVDCTWDDNDDTKYYGFDARHLYFGLTDELMAIAHPGHKKIYTANSYGTRSISLADNYYVKSGTAAEWADAYAARIQARLDAKEAGFSITSDNALNPPSIIGIQNAIVAYAINQKDWAPSDGLKAMLTATSNVTTTSSTTWTAVYDFAVDYLTDVSAYKPSSDSSKWTYPTKDGYAFAGWYTDETCSTAYTETSGQAYARFVPVSDLVSYTGAGLRDEYKATDGYDRTTLRFCYEFSAPSGSIVGDASWWWKNGNSGYEEEVSVENYWLSGGDSIVANLALTGIRRNGAKSTYQGVYQIRGKISYVTADGTEVSVEEAAANSASVAQVASAISSGSCASSAEREYAKGILGSLQVEDATVAENRVVEQMSVSAYKPSSDSSKWTYPTKDGYAFAGWYTDETCSTAYTETSGQAYARFVPVSDLVSYTGAGLRDEYKATDGYDRTTLRFCYEFSAPSGSIVGDASWWWKNGNSGYEEEVSVENYWLSGGDSIVANLALTGIRRNGAKSTYQGVYQIRGKISYTTADGTEVSVEEAEANSASVARVASAISSGSCASSAEREYADGILG